MKYISANTMCGGRAAFKAGVKPSQIVRQFGLTQSEVRQALDGRIEGLKATATWSKESRRLPARAPRRHRP